MPNIVYKTLGFKWLNQSFCPASAFVSAHRNEARNPQRFIHATVRGNFNKNNSNSKINEKSNDFNLCCLYGDIDYGTNG